MKINKFRNRYQSLDESRARTSTVRQSVYFQANDQMKQQIKKLEFQHYTLQYYITRVCRTIKEMRKYRQDNFIKSVLMKIYKTTHHLSEIQEVFRIPLGMVNEELILTRCTQQLVSQQTQSLRPQNQLIHFIKWFIHFDELLFVELQKMNDIYLLGLKSNIHEQLITNVRKQQELKHQIGPKKKDLYNYVNSLVSKPKYKIMSDIEKVEQFEMKYGEFNIINIQSRHFAKSLNMINSQVNLIE